MMLKNFTMTIKFAAAEITLSNKVLYNIKNYISADYSLRLRLKSKLNIYKCQIECQIEMPLHVDIQ